VTDLRFLEAIPGGDELPAGADAADGDEALDAYSRVVTRVVDHLLPSVASLRVWKRTRAERRAEGSGSGVAISKDGFVLTSAHVVHGTDGGSATFVDGAELGLEVVGADPLSDMAVVRATGAGSVTLTAADQATLAALPVFFVVVATTFVLPFVTDEVGAVYVITAAVLGALFIVQAIRLARDTTPAQAIRLFTYSNTYLALLFAAVAVDTLLRAA